MENDTVRSRMINTDPTTSEIESIRSYAENNRVAAQEGRKCVDGRYSADQGTGMIARPGGDFGYVMALMAVSDEVNLGLRPQECFDKIYSLVTGDGGQFYMHTDHHADPEDNSGHQDHLPLIGCGHIAKASVPDMAKMYGVDPLEIKEVVGYARDEQNAGKNITMVNLSGEHQEKDVLVVRGENQTLNPHNEQEMHFLYDQDRDETFMKGLVGRLQQTGVPVTYEQFKAASDRQLNATLQILAGGKAMYQVNLQDMKPTVSFAATIPQFQAD